ncbi:MAG: glutathione S-transferase N-terminal domain-containing protein [Myxococcales bacterium]|nr:glutathione S-transferase N-terminal domain-containing protein [Myxococcales bacterium]
MTTESLRLYLMRGCPYCEDVRAAIRDLGIEIEERDIYGAREDMEALVAARGRRTVPVLRIGEDEWMPESQDIIAYLYERFGEGRTPPRRGWW